MSTSPTLLPAPREMRPVADGYELADHRLIVLDSAAPQTLLFSARRLQAALRTHRGSDLGDRGRRCCAAE